ncbi:MAG TPA: fibronectin type III domain-containing protein, partial [Clostridia bacterium]
MRKKIILRIIVWIIILGMLAAFVVDLAFAQVIPSTPPQNLRVSDIGYENEAGQNWFAAFSWNLPTYPPEATQEKSQTFSFNRIERGSGRITSNVAEITLGSTTTSFTTSGYGIELDHGTIYELYGTSSYTYGDFGQYTFTSGKSNRVKFLTHLEFGAELISGTNEIKIVWDDVWDTNGRIDYRILISDTSGFTQPPSVPDIIGSQIGTENSKVTASGGRLEYIYTNALPGREYSIKVIPLVNTDVAVIPEEELPVVRVKTEILLRAKKMGETSDGVRWMLFWDPIIKGSIGSTTFTKVEYKLYRHDKAGNTTFFALVIDRDRFEMILKPEDVEKYTYSIEAVAYKPDGSTVPFYSSTKVALVEQIPEYPTAPEFVKSFPTADPAPLVFDDLLTSNSATLLWRVPVSGDGKVDTEVYYDLYLVDEIDEMNT